MPEYMTPLEDLAGDLFVNRHEELRLGRKWIQDIPLMHLNSWALVGRRRTGKTAILVKLFNEMFSEQDRILPVFITFAHYVKRTEPISYYDFAEEYFGGYLRCYLAFRYRKPLLIRDNANIEKSLIVAQKMNDAYALELYDEYEQLLKQTRQASAHSLAQWVINFPKAHAATRDMPTAIIIDEFQVLTRVYDPLQNLHHDLTDSFQWASETHWAPLLLSGSAVTVLVEQAFGGLLSGRIGAWHLKPLSREYSHDLVFRFGKRHSIPITETFAEAIYQLTGGYPYSIEKLLTSRSPVVSEFPSLEALEQVMEFELGDVNGRLSQHYDWEFRKYSDLLNSGQITRKVMFWATKYPEERIEAKRIATELGISVDEVQAALEKLLQADLVTRVSWTLFNGPADPMLRRYIRYHYYQEIEDLSPTEALKDWHAEYQRLQGRINNFVGEVAEVYVEAVMRAFDGRAVDGMTYFSTAGTVTLPTFKTIERRGGIVKHGIPFEIDLTGIGAEAVWIV
ncbi:MAG: ATP-binding protein, partial [bacterium]|nr:ATP-binding protein [bacterium]